MISDASLNILLIQLSVRLQSCRPLTVSCTGKATCRGCPNELWVEGIALKDIVFDWIVLLLFKPSVWYVFSREESSDLNVK